MREVVCVLGFVEVCCGEQGGHRVDVLRCADFESLLEPE